METRAWYFKDISNDEIKRLIDEILGVGIKGYHLTILRYPDLDATLIIESTNYIVDQHVQQVLSETTNEEFAKIWNTRFKIPMEQYAAKS